MDGQEKQRTANPAKCVEKQIIHIEYTHTCVQLHGFKEKADKKDEENGFKNSPGPEQQKRKEKAKRNKAKDIAADIPVFITITHVTVDDALDGSKQLEILLLEAGNMSPVIYHFLYMCKRSGWFFKKNIFCKNAQVRNQQQPANDLQDRSIFLHRHYYYCQNCCLPASRASYFYQLA